MGYGRIEFSLYRVLITTGYIYDQFWPPWRPYLFFYILPLQQPTHTLTFSSPEIAIRNFVINLKNHAAWEISLESTFKKIFLKKKKETKIPPYRKTFFKFFHLQIINLNILVTWSLFLFASVFSDFLYSSCVSLFFFLFIPLRVNIILVVLRMLR